MTMKMTRAILVLAMALLAGCTETESLRFVVCDPQMATGGRVSMNTPCVGWSNGYEVGRSRESVAAPGFPVHKSLMIYHDGKHIEAVIVKEQP